MNDADAKQWFRCFLPPFKCSTVRLCVYYTATFPLQSAVTCVYTGNCTSPCLASCFVVFRSLSLCTHRRRSFSQRSDFATQSPSTVFCCLCVHSNTTLFAPPFGPSQHDSMHPNRLSSPGADALVDQVTAFIGRDALPPP